jgi:hypothetical protein
MENMDQIRLKQCAAQLESLLMNYSLHNEAAAGLHVALAPLISDAHSGSLVQPIEWSAIPDGWLFAEGMLRAYPDLENAYAEFKIEVTGGESDVLRKFRSRIEDGE